MLKFLNPKWKGYNPQSVRKRYNHLASIYPIFELIFFFPSGIRNRTVKILSLKKGDTVLEVGCGTGRNLSLLRDAVGDEGRVYGVDISEQMLKRADELKRKNNWENVRLFREDAVNFRTDESLNGVLFSLSYATIEHRYEVLSNLLSQLKQGGCIVIMDSRFPQGIPGKLITPFKPVIIQFLKATVLGNPYVKPVEELAEITGCKVEVEELSAGFYFIAKAVKKQILGQNS
jgi:ubiquinone/menaquinone biosynthesis C-methylase UbiE